MNGCSGNLMQAIRGPILLMVLGGLFAIDHFGPWPFWRTWPVLVIVFGVMKLLERSGAKPRRLGTDDMPGVNLP